MAANTAPIFGLVPNNSWAKVTGVDGGTDGTDADVQLIMTAGAEGANILRLILQPISTSGSTTTSAAAARIYLNNGAAVGTGTNNLLFREHKLIATAVDVAGTSDAKAVLIPMNFVMKASYKLYIGITAMAANTQWNVLAEYMDY